MSEFIGIDVSKAVLDVAAHASGTHLQVENSEQGFKQLCDELVGLAPELVVMEASGGDERLCAAALAHAGLPVAVVNARQVRAFALATGVLAKSDTVDARVLAHFAAAVRPAVRPLPDEQRAVLDELMGRRRQLVGMLVMEKNRLAQARDLVESRGQEGHGTRHIPDLVGALGARYLELRISLDQPVCDCAERFQGTRDRAPDPPHDGRGQPQSQGQ